MGKNHRNTCTVAHAQNEGFFIFFVTAMTTKPNLELLTKIIIIGDPTVGKTSFTARYIDNSSPKDYKLTIGVDFGLKIIKWNNEMSLRVQLWDIAGQDRNHSLMHVYYRGTNGCLILFDITNRESFSNA